MVLNHSVWRIEWQTRMTSSLSAIVILTGVLAACGTPATPPEELSDSAEGSPIVVAEGALPSTTQMIQRFGFTPQIHHRALSLAQIKTQRMVRSTFLI